MTLGQTQRIFTRNIGCLIEYAYEMGYELSFGEAERTKSQVLLNYYGYEVMFNKADGIYLEKRNRTSKTLDSNHLERLAVDFNVFKDGVWISSFEETKFLGVYWVSLHPKNRWGGDFNKNGIKDGFIDTPHFEMQR